MILDSGLLFLVHPVYEIKHAAWNVGLGVNSSDLYLVW